MGKKTFERPFIKKINAGVPSKFGLQPTIEVIDQIDGVPVKALIKEHGSPLVVFSEKTIREKYQEASRAFSTRYPKVQFAWSYKTNYLDAICKVYHQEGSWAEVVSGFEYEKALALGVDPKKIIFNGPWKDTAELKKAIANDSLVHIDHFDELYTITNLAIKMEKKPKVAIRVNMDCGIYPAWDRFGFNYENGEAWDAINRIMINKKLELVGLHTHIGTYIMSTEAYKTAAMKMADLAANIYQKYDYAIHYLDMGGGFASRNTLKGAYLSGSDTTPSFDDYAEAITTGIINSRIKPDHLPLLILETGRALIDDAGYMLGTVVANKKLSDGSRATIVDTGVNTLFTSFWYEHPINPASAVSQYTEETSVFGPLCMNIDVIRQKVVFPLLKKGDHFVISRVGAYNVTQWLQFITYRPNVVLISPGGKAFVIRRKEILDDFNDMEQLPEHLLTSEK